MIRKSSLEKAAKQETISSLEEVAKEEEIKRRIEKRAKKRKALAKYGLGLFSAVASIVLTINIVHNVNSRKRVARFDEYKQRFSQYMAAENHVVRENEYKQLINDLKSEAHPSFDDFKKQVTETYHKVFKPKVLKKMKITDYTLRFQQLKNQDDYSSTNKNLETLITSLQSEKESELKKLLSEARAYQKDVVAPGILIQERNKKISGYEQRLNEFRTERDYKKIRADFKGFVAEVNKEENGDFRGIIETVNEYDQKVFEPRYKDFLEQEKKLLEEKKKQEERTQFSEAVGKLRNSYSDANRSRSRSKQEIYNLLIPINNQIEELRRKYSYSSSPEYSSINKLNRQVDNSIIQCIKYRIQNIRQEAANRSRTTSSRIYVPSRRTSGRYSYYNSRAATVLTNSMLQNLINEALNTFRTDPELLQKLVPKIQAYMRIRRR